MADESADNERTDNESTDNQQTDNAVDSSESEAPEPTDSMPEPSFESDVREYMQRIDAKLTQLEKAQAAIVSTARITDSGGADDASQDNDGMDDGVLDLVIKD